MKIKKTTRSAPQQQNTSSTPEHLRQLLQMAQLRAEKCELKEAKECFLVVLDEAKKSGELTLAMEAIAGLLRLAGEALDLPAMENWDQELDRLMTEHPHQIPPMAWYCKGAVARHRGQWRWAQRCFHRYLRQVRNSSEPLQSSGENILKGWVMLAILAQNRNHLARSLWLAQELLRRHESKDYRGMNGILYLLLGTLFERRKEFHTALQWFQKAHAQCMGDHNWYYHLYALYGYARIARHQKNYSQAHWYLDLVDKAAGSAEFGLLKREINEERGRLERDAVDLLIDSRQGIIQTRESGSIELGKQFVLLNILEALSGAHERRGSDHPCGLSKAEIIEAVWHEPYQPHTHDNKLYYNINRIRKLIEPNVSKPQYLLNWKEGYQLAPGLRVHWVNPVSQENALSHVDLHLGRPKQFLKHSPRKHPERTDA